ncbi:MAG TPA: SRPBCC domain-containing protein [Bacteroidia bacterium]|jgi:uncharacterized protein YndB with AHSA1/START domain|nr:SRPBCC domain-containing protein [Bacteroidia bacterium]
MQKEVKQTWHFNHSPQKVWEYLTKPELIEQWLMTTNFQPIVGYKFSFSHSVKNKSDYEGTTHCEVLEVNPFTRLSYTWNGKTLDGIRVFNSKVVWILIPKENGTELQLVHTGFSTLEDVVAHDAGWNICLKQFEERINTINQ